HLASPHKALGLIRNRKRIGVDLLNLNASRREEESLEVRRRIDQAGGPFILAGDFNTPDDSQIFHQAWKGLRDAFGTAGFGFGTTYAKNHTWIRIDHILSTPDWRCTECWEGPDIGSGHRPVFAQLER
ncbi:MAG TPA: endonuclease/exonuclease/phosphatase family protein, partial [Acidobacteriaceae bacterium]